ncbi:uncharacterized protein LOC106511547 [Austrofundulus limnaeus]|uniref:Uncharacterized protein LOC106511547 n=1 Tax=Austrofundulus limnaeus TaxID=52670 RepID=A0A2I4AJW8_AUSLI|nr:PREDICTED: uncharacterized protein LOC106511547 [Austrofundulus limnaeus]
MQGNALVKQRRFREAASKYKEAVLLLKTVQSREMPGDVDYINLGRMIVPLELNYCQCMLELEEYYEVIEHTTELLEKHKDCVKAYYKRAKAHAAVWNEKEAQRDFRMVGQLDTTLSSLVHRELKALMERMKEKYWEEKEQFWNKLETTESKSKRDEEEAEEGEQKKEENLESVATETTTGDGSAQPECAEVNDEAATSEGGEEEEESSCSVVSFNVCDKTEGKDWQQMLRLVMLLQNEGNFHIKQKHFQEASAKFKEALEYVDFLQNKQVDQGGEDWESLEKVRLPLALNLSQCMLELKQYQEVVELNDRVLRQHKGNFKAVYQRARAHAALCNEDEARRDFALVEKLDPKFKPFVRQELKKLGENLRTVHARQNKTYWDASKEKWGPGGSKTKREAGKKNIKFAPKATEEHMDKKPESCEVEETESSKAADPAEAEAATVKSPALKAEQPNKEPEYWTATEDGLDNENTERVVTPEAGQGVPDNHEAHKDSDGATTSADNVVSERSACDKAKKKVKSRADCAANPSRTNSEIKATRAKTGKGGSVKTNQ